MSNNNRISLFIFNVKIIQKHALEQQSVMGKELVWQVHAIVLVVGMVLSVLFKVQIIIFENIIASNFANGLIGTTLIVIVTPTNSTGPTIGINPAEDTGVFFNIAFREIREIDQNRSIINKKKVKSNEFVLHY